MSPLRTEIIAIILEILSDLPPPQPKFWLRPWISSSDFLWYSRIAVRDSATAKHDDLNILNEVRNSMFTYNECPKRVTIRYKECTTWTRMRTLSSWERLLRWSEEKKVLFHVQLNTILYIVYILVLMLLLLGTFHYSDPAVSNLIGRKRISIRGVSTVRQ